MSEKDYIAGSEAAYRSVLLTCTQRMHGVEKKRAELLRELSETRVALSMLADTIGIELDNDDLYLADVVGKEILPAIRELIRGKKR